MELATARCPATCPGCQLDCCSPWLQYHCWPATHRNWTKQPWNLRPSPCTGITAINYTDANESKKVCVRVSSSSPWQHHKVLIGVHVKKAGTALQIIYRANARGSYFCAVLMTRWTVRPSFMPCWVSVSPSFRILPAKIKTNWSCFALNLLEISSLNYKRERN